jgi:DNA-binding winged helix-turn-helix (wHTH) protein
MDGGMGSVRNSPVEYRFDRFVVHTGERRLLAGVDPVAVGPRAFDFLLTLLERPGQLVTKDELVHKCGRGLVVEESNLPAQVFALRRILGVRRRSRRYPVTVIALHCRSRLASRFPSARGRAELSFRAR